MSKGKSKRTISPEQQAKMQAGRAKARTHKKRMEQVGELETRIKTAQRNANKPVRLGRRKRYRFE